MRYNCCVSLTAAPLTGGAGGGGGEGGITSGAIAGIAVGGVVGVVIIIAICIYLLWKFMRQAEEKKRYVAEPPPAISVICKYYAKYFDICKLKYLSFLFWSLFYEYFNYLHFIYDKSWISFFNSILNYNKKRSLVIDVCFVYSFRRIYCEWHSKTSGFRWKYKKEAWI